MTKHKHGSMDVSAQEKTFSGFVKGLFWLVGVSIAVLIFLAIFNS